MQCNLKVVVEDMKMQSLAAVKMPQQPTIFDRSHEISCDNTVEKT